MEALGQLTGGIAHDFNNLLWAMQGTFALIRKRPDDSERVRMLAEEGISAARRGGSLTAQLLAFARSQQTMVRPGLKPVLEGMQDLLQRSLGPVAAVSVEVEDPGFAAIVDPAQLERAVLNLAINARDTMSEGGAITITAEALHKEDDPELSQGDYVLVCARDTGAGMTPEVARPVSVSSVVYDLLNAPANTLLSVAIFSLGILAASLRFAAQGAAPCVRQQSIGVGPLRSVG